MSSPSFFLQPDGLARLMYQPDGALLSGWVAAVAAQQDGLAPGSLQHQAWTLGPQFRLLLDRAAELRWNVYHVFVVLVYVLCTPDARLRLPPHDHEFLNAHVRPIVDAWIDGLVLTSGAHMTRASEAKNGLVTTLVALLMDRYAVMYLFPMPN